MKFPHTPLFHCFLHDKSSPNIPAYEHINVKHNNAMARATSRATSRRVSFSNTLYWDNIPARRVTYIALDVASVVPLMYGQSRDCRLCRRVPNRARAGVFLVLKYPRLGLL